MNTNKFNMNIEFFEDDFNDAVTDGIYEIIVKHNEKSRCLYIGESVYVLKRCSEHLYDFFNRPKYFGFTEENMENPNITLIFRLISDQEIKAVFTELNKEDKLDKTKVGRVTYETQLIKDRKPLSQSGVSDWMKSIKEKEVKMSEFLTGKSK